MQWAVGSGASAALSAPSLHTTLVCSMHNVRREGSQMALAGLQCLIRSTIATQSSGATAASIGNTSFLARSLQFSQHCSLSGNKGGGSTATCSSDRLQLHQTRSYAAKVTIPSRDSLPLRTGRPRLLVLGTGWAGARLMRDIDPKLYDLAVISERNHMVFTPLLASSTVGTLDGRSVTVHIADIQKELRQPQNAIYIASAVGVYPDRKVVECKSADGVRFYVGYDKLAICTGSQGSTFGIPGVKEHTHFLRDVQHAEAIRAKLIDNVALAGIPGRPFEEFQRLLHTVIVGGGPTGVEFAGELTDFIRQDLARQYPERARNMRITVIEAKEVLGSFDGSLREYAARKLIRRGVVLMKGVVAEVTPTEVKLKDGTVLPYGLCVWSTGVGPTPFTLSLPFAKTAVGRLSVDKYLRVLCPPKLDAKTGHVRGEGEATGPGANVGPLTDEGDSPSLANTEVVPDVYAMGDCCANPDTPLPALAQVAEQQGRYLARVLNAEARSPLGATSGVVDTPPEEFVYKSLGSMATVGGYSGVLELGRPSPGGSGGGLSLAGFWSWVAWRSAYLTRLGSMRKRLAVAFDWTTTLLFGRDMSRW